MSFLASSLKASNSVVRVSSFASLDSIFFKDSSIVSSFSSFSKIFCSFAATSYDILRAVITSSSCCSGPTVSGESYFIGFFASGDVVESSEESDDLNVFLLSRLLKISAISHHAKCKVGGQSHRTSLLRHYST